MDTSIWKRNLKLIKFYNAAIKLIMDEVDPLKSFNEAVYASGIAET